MTTVEMLDEFRRQSPGQFAWRQPPYEYEHEKMPIDILYGSTRLREAVDAGRVQPLLEEAAREADRFRKTRERYLLY